MKNNIIRVLCLLLVAAMCLSFVGCKKKETKDSKKSNIEGVEELGEDETEDIDNPDDGTETSNGGSTAANGGAGGSKGGSTSGGNAGGSSGASAVAGNADSLSWAQLVASMPKELRGTTVKVYSWNPAKDVSGAEKVIADFTKKTGIKIDWKAGNYDTYDQDILAKVKAGDSPDMIRYNYPAPARMSMTQDIKSATGNACSSGVWDANVAKAYTVKGKVYGVNLQNTFNQQPTAIAYSMSTVKKYKLEDPFALWKKGAWNYNKFIQMCKEFKSQSENGAWMTSRELDCMWFQGIQMVKFDGNKYTNNVTSAEVVKGLQQCCRNLADGISPEAASEGDKLEDGSYLFYTTSMLQARRTDWHLPELKKSNDLYWVPFPTGNGTYYQNYLEYEAYGIPKGAKNASGAYYFMRYYLDRANYDESTFFVNNSALETYNWCRNQTKVNYNTERPLTSAVGNQLGSLDTWVRTGGKAEQVQSQVGKVKNIFDQAVDQANKTIASFK